MTKPNKTVANERNRKMVKALEENFGESEIMADKRVEELKSLNVYDRVRKSSFKLGPKLSPIHMWVVRAYLKPKS